MTAAAAPIADYAPSTGVAKRAWRELRELVTFRHLVRHLVSTSLRTELASTRLGVIWWILDPLALTAVYYVLVSVILQVRTPHYPLYVLTAIISWEFFARSIMMSMTMTLAKEGSMRQVAYPRSAVPLAATLTQAVHFAFGLGVVLVLLPVFGLSPGKMVLLVLPLALLELVLTLGVAYLLAATNVFFRDVKHLTDHVLWLLFHLAPALYLASLIPARWRGTYELNPFATLFDGFRSVVMYNRLPGTTLLHFGLLAGASLAVLAVGFICFVRASRSFAKVA